MSIHPDDTTPPITTITTDPPEPVYNGWYALPVSVTLNATDNESGVNATYYQINNQGWVIYTHSFYLIECGITDFQFYSVDNAGNVEEINQMEIKIDCYPPILNYTIDPPEPDGLNGWYVSNVTITLNATDNESGVKYPTDKTINITEDGEIPVELWAIDNVGNEVTPHCTFIIMMDQTKPTITLEYEVIGGGILQSWEFTFIATATDGTTGMERVEFYFNNVLQKTVTGPGPTYQWTIKKTWIPNITIKAIAYDNAGNNGSDEIQDPHPRSIRQNLPFKTKINLGNFLLLRYFYRLRLIPLIINFISYISDKKGISNEYILTKI